MNFLPEVNLVNLLLIGIFVMPLIKGLFSRPSREKVRYSTASLLDNVEFLIGLVISVYLTKKIFFDNEDAFFRSLYGMIPEQAKAFLDGRDVLTYLLAVPLILLLVMAVLRFITNPLYRYMLGPLADRAYYSLIQSNGLLRRIISAACQLPRSLCLVFAFSVILNFMNYYLQAPIIGKWMNESAAYQLLYKNAVYPVLNSNIAKQIPVIINDSFAKTAGSPSSGVKYGMGEIVDRLTGGNIKVIEYFNGVTLDEAVKSTPDIDKTAIQVTQEAESSREKAFVIYDWITENVVYDYEKAEKISTGQRNVSSGAIVAYETGKGICFDYSSLYVSMCRAVDLKVRLVTGLGFSGISWGDHAWNQVYIEEEDRWINVDTTFGTNGDYFDKPDFSVDHKYDEIQGEW